MTTATREEPKPVRSRRPRYVPEHLTGEAWHARRLAAEHRRRQAAEWYKQGYLLREIAAAYGVCESLICKDLKHLEREEQRQREIAALPVPPSLPTRDA